MTSRSLWAAILFDNLMATSGFVRNGLSPPLPAAVALAGFLIVLGSHAGNGRDTC